MVRSPIQRILAEETALLDEALAESNTAFLRPIFSVSDDSTSTICSHTSNPTAVERPSAILKLKRAAPYQRAMHKLAIASQFLYGFFIIAKTGQHNQTKLFLY